MKQLISKALTSAGVAAVFALATPGAQAATIQLGSFESASGAYTYDAGELTGTTTGSFTFDPDAVAEFGIATANYANATLTVDALATGGVTTTPIVGGTIGQQLMDGYIEVKDGATVLLRADFTNAILGGILGELTIVLSADSLTSTILYSTDVFDASRLVDPKALKFTLNPLPAGLALNGNNFANFQAPDAANFSSSVTDDSTDVPEPASMALLGLGLMGAAFARRRRQ